MSNNSNTADDDAPAGLGPADRMIQPENHHHPDYQHESKMEDRFYLAYFLFYAMGTLTLVPVNFFTTANDYWMYKFRDPSNESYDPDKKTGLQTEFTSDYSIVSNVFSVAFLVLTVFLAKKIGMVTRFLIALSTTIFVFLLTVIFVKVDTDSWQIGFFVFTMITGALLTAAGSMFMVTLFQLVSRFPPAYMASILSGQSVCGIFAALVQIFALGIGASSTTTGLVYFLIGMFFVVLTFAYFLLVLKKSEFFSYYLNKQAEEMNTALITKEKFWVVFKKVAFYLVSMIVVLGCSIMIHPAVTSLVQSMDKGNGKKWNDTFFVPVATFLLYNVFDLIGRESAGKIQLPRNGPIVLTVSLLRIAFVPLLMLCNAHPRNHLPVVFGADWAYVVFIMIFAFSNGYLVNLCIICIPKTTNPDEKLVASILIVVLMVTSMGTCAILSAVLVKAL